HDHRDACRHADDRLHGHAGLGVSLGLSPLRQRLLPSLNGHLHQREAAMQKRNAIMLALAATMTAVAVPAAAYYLTAPSDDEYAKTMRGLGFMPLPLPSDLITVGALYYVDPSARYFRTACAVESGDLDGVLKKYRATQVSGDALRKGRFSTNFRVDVGAALGGDGGANYEQRVHYSLTDVFVEEIALSHNRT